MVYRFTVISNEVDDFIREIKIEADATFFDFQNIRTLHMAFSPPTSIHGKFHKEE